MEAAQTVHRLPVRLAVFQIWPRERENGLSMDDSTRVIQWVNKPGNLLSKYVGASPKPPYTGSSQSWAGWSCLCWIRGRQFKAEVCLLVHFSFRALSMRRVVIGRSRSRKRLPEFVAHLERSEMGIDAYVPALGGSTSGTNGRVGNAEPPE